MKANLPLLVLLYLLAFGHAAAQDPDIEANEQSVLEEQFRSSDLDHETPVARRDRDNRRKRVSVPEGAFRVGCICMDNSFSKHKSSGACSGHGGVRYWLYRTREGDTVRVLTARHEHHPQALNAEEMSELNQKRAEKTANLIKPNTLQPLVIHPAAEKDGYFDWSDAAAISAGGLSAYFIVRMVLQWIDKNPELVKYALRNMLRHRRRPAARKNRKTPPAPRV